MLKAWVAGVIGTVAFSAGLAWAVEPRASAQLKDTAGRDVGTVTLTQSPNGVIIEGNLRGLPQGEHAVHLHAVGACNPNFEAAAGHFNPGQGRHGYFDQLGPHGGDLPNVHVGSDGKAKFDLLNPRIQVAAGTSSIMDADGTAVIVHAKPDDYHTDPAGDAGGRIACGVVKAAPAQQQRR